MTQETTEENQRKTMAGDRNTPEKVTAARKEMGLYRPGETVVRP
jgi:hypothetical protein